MSVYRVTDLDDEFAGTTQYEITRAGDDGWTIQRQIAGARGWKS